MQGGRARLVAAVALVVITAALTTLINQTFFAPADSIAVAPPPAESRPETRPSGPGAGAAELVSEPIEPARDAPATGAGLPGTAETAAEPAESGTDSKAADESESEAAEAEPDSGESEPGAGTADTGHSHPSESESPKPAPKLCVVADGDPDKLYWGFVQFHAERAAAIVGLQLEYSTHPDPAKRVLAIEGCARNGAHMILATLADAQLIVPALHAAAEQGVRIASFGAGAKHADDAGSLIHVSMDAAASARRAAEQFHAAGVSGKVLCLIPEAVEEGRRHICDELRESYAGAAVTAHQLDSSDADRQIADLLAAAPDAAGLLVLEADLLPHAIEAMDSSGIAPVLGSIGEFPLSKLSFAQRDQIAFTVMDLARFEVLLSAAALRLMHTYHPNARFFEGAMIFEGQPNVHTGGARGGHERPGAGEDAGHGGGGHDHSHGDDGHDH